MAWAWGATSSVKRLTGPFWTTPRIVSPDGGLSPVTEHNVCSPAGCGSSSLSTPNPPDSALSAVANGDGFTAWGVVPADEGIPYSSPRDFLQPSQFPLPSRWRGQFPIRHPGTPQQKHSLGLLSPLPPLPPFPFSFGAGSSSPSFSCEWRPYRFPLLLPRMSRDKFNTRPSSRCNLRSAALISGPPPSDPAALGSCHSGSNSVLAVVHRY